MKRPQFAERQYEAAAHIELARGKASPFVPTQTIEYHLGIDAAADPEKRHAIWRILSVKIPRRLTLSPALWPALPRHFHDEIPGKYCSLFLQFKRPVFQDSKRAKYHSRMGGPYFEVGITLHQQEALLQLQKRVEKLAVVRYASPAFWSRDDFDLHDERRQVLVNSAYLQPSQVKHHKKWMYAGVTGKILLNPYPEELESEKWENVIAELGEKAIRQSLRDHIRDLATEIEERREQEQTVSEPSWLTRIAEYAKLSNQDNALLQDLSVVAVASENADSTWIILLLPDENWRESFTYDRTWFHHYYRWDINGF